MLTKIDPTMIEKRSFEIIKDEFFEQTSLDPEEISPDHFSIIQRVIHATADFSFADTLFFHQDAVASGLRSLRGGRDIYIDVTMGASGINKRTLSSFGGSVICRINDPEIAAEAAKKGKTKTETALRKSCQDHNVGIIAVGNAPTALIAAMDMIENRVIHPDLVIGVPVGFVNAAESKELLREKPYPFITALGRKGGTPVAVSILNALLKLAAVET